MHQNVDLGMGCPRLPVLYKAGGLMNETELNKMIDELITNESWQEHQDRKARTRRNRRNRIHKTDRLFRIINYGGYAPHRGYIDDDYEGKTLLHSGKYIKYPKNSNCQKWLKELTSRRMRNCPDVPRKGNYHRRLLDYWWILY